MKNPIYPCLWFDGNAKEAAEFYCSVFKNSQVISDTPVVVNFALDGYRFMGLNGGPQYNPNPSVSFFKVFRDLQELNSAWNKLVQNGSVLMPLDKYAWSERYGWVQDRFGINWQLSLGKAEDVRQSFVPALMFTEQQAGNAAKAIEYYTSVFDNSSIEQIEKYTAEDNDQEGLVKYSMFSLNNNFFIAMDSTMPHGFTFSEGVSFVVECEDQEEIDYYWNKFTAEGEESMCGWLKDKYGVSWQIIPEVLKTMMSNPDKAQQVANSFMQMRKFDIERLVEAYEA